VAESTEDRERRFRAAAEDFRAGRTAQARLRWKTLWDEEEDETHRSLLQALMQTCAAIEKRGADREAARRLLALAEAKLAALPDAFGGIDVAALRRALGGLDDPAAAVPDLAVAGIPLPWRRVRPRPPTVPPPERPAHFRRALAAYASGRFFEAHELWEDLWRDEKDAAHRNFVQALIQVAAAMHKLEQGGTTGPVHLLGRALVRLDGVRDGYAGIAVDLLRGDCARAREAIERLAAEGRALLDPGLVPRIEARE
jgi:hypothetical protein